MDSGRGYQQFFAELKRRRVFRVMAIYGAVGFVLLQVAELLGEGLRLPEYFLSLVTALVLVGFPIAIVLAWAFETTPEGIRRTEDATDEEIAAILAEPATRRWPAGLLALIGIVALVAGAWWVGRRTAPATSTDAADEATGMQLAVPAAVDEARPTIAVLPFADMSPEGDQEYFSDGITEELSNVLAGISELTVMARTSAFAFKEKDLDMRTIGDSLDVGYLVEGSVRKAGDELRITAQLIDAEDGSHVWSQQYDRRLDDVFAIQTEIAEAIANELRVPLGLVEGERLVSPTEDIEAYDLYLAGRTRMRERGDALGEAISLFEAAIARDSSWAPAWASLAEVSEIKVWYPWSFREEFTDAKQWVREAHETAELAANRALELDPDNGSALVALGNVQRNRAEWEAAERTYLQALAADPEYAEAHHQYADLLFNMGRIDEAVRALDRAYALDPAPVRGRALSWALILDDRTDEALQLLEHVLASAAGVAPRRRTTWEAMDAAMRLGEMEKALDLADRERALGPDPDPDPRLADLDSAEYRALNAAAAQSLAEGKLELWPEEFRDWIFPWQWMLLEEPDRAVTELLEQMGRPIYGRVAEVWDPLFDPVRDDPRIRSFLAERGLADAVVQRTPRDQRQLPIVLRREDL